MAPAPTPPARRRRSDAGARCGSRSASRRSVARCGSSCARCGACRSGSPGRPPSGCPTAARSGSAGGLRERVHVVGPPQASPEGLVAGADVACVASGGPRVAAGLVRKALASETVPVASRLAALPGADRRRRARAAVSPGDAVTLAGQLERLIAEPALREELASAGRDAVPELGRGRRSGRGRLPAALRSTPRCPRAPRLRAGSRAGARSTSTCTCTPTIHRIAPHRSRCCWPPRGIVGSGRSRSPTTTRSPAPWRRARSPRRWEASR